MKSLRKEIILILLIFLIISGIIIFFTLNTDNASDKTEKQFNDIISEIADGSFEEALKNGEIDEEGYPVDNDGNRTSDSPLLFKADVKKLYEDSVLYNENIVKNQFSLLISEEAYSNYAALDLTDYGIFNGIYAYIYAPSIDLFLPIYLGANDKNMSLGAAHLTYTSLPTGGENSNVVLSAHTGYAGRIFFDNIKYLKAGDKVIIKNYWGDVTYTVKKSLIRTADDSRDIYISDGEDLLTLITCISDGSGGFNRYLVVCDRNTEE